MPEDNTTPTNQPTVEPDTTNARPTTTAGEMSQRLNDVVAKVIEKIEGADSILVALSQDPSVDEMAAAIGLTMLLDNMGKHATAIYSGATPNALEFLEPEKTFEPNTNSLQDFIIALDKEKADHLRYKIEGDFVKVYITPYKTTLDTADLEYSHGDFNVDLVISLDVESGEDLDSALAEYGRIMHDATAINITTGAPGRFAEVEWSDPESSSVCEMIVKLVRAMGEKAPAIEKEVATALLTGIVAGTDRFSNDRTSSGTMEVAASLMDAGADQQLVSSNIMKEGEKAAPVVEAAPVETGTVVEPEQPAENGGLSVAHEEENKMVTEPEIEKQDFDQQIQPVVPVDVAAPVEVAPVAPPELPTVPEMAVPAVPAAPVMAAVPEVPSVPEVPVAPEVSVTPEAPVVPEVPAAPEVPAESVAEPVPVTIGVPAEAVPEPAPVEPPVMPVEPAAPVEAPVEPVAPVAEPEAPAVPDIPASEPALAPLTPSEDLQPAAVSVPAAVHDLSAVPEVAPVTPDYAEVEPVKDDGAIDYGKLMDEALAEPLPIELEQQAAAQAAEMAAASAAGTAVPIVSPPEENPAVQAAPAVAAPEPVPVAEPVAQPVQPAQPMVMPGVDILPPPPMPPVDMNIPMPEVMPGAVVDPNAAQMPQPQPEIPMGGAPVQPVEQPAQPAQPQDPGAFQIPGM